MVTFQGICKSGQQAVLNYFYYHFQPPCKGHTKTFQPNIDNNKSSLMGISVERLKPVCFTQTVSPSRLQNSLFSLKNMVGFSFQFHSWIACLSSYSISQLGVSHEWTGRDFLSTSIAWRLPCVRNSTLMVDVSFCWCDVYLISIKQLSNDMVFGDSCHCGSCLFSSDSWSRKGKSVCLFIYYLIFMLPISPTRQL